MRAEHDQDEHLDCQRRKEERCQHPARRAQRIADTQAEETGQQAHVLEVGEELEVRRVESNDQQLGKQSEPRRHRDPPPNRAVRQPIECRRVAVQIPAEPRPPCAGRAPHEGPDRQREQRREAEQPAPPRRSGVLPVVRQGEHTPRQPHQARHDQGAARDDRGIRRCCLGISHPAHSSRGSQDPPHRDPANASVTPATRLGPRLPPLAPRGGPRPRPPAAGWPRPR